MDWTERAEQKKKIRKMACRMLWADVRRLLFSWKIIMVLCAVVGFCVLPYIVEENFNAGAMYYMFIWGLISIYAVAEQEFNFLPLSTRDIVYYLNCRTNLLTGSIMVVSIATLVALLVFDNEVFVERGLVSVVFLLVTVEWLHFITLYGYSKPDGVSILDEYLPKGVKVRVVIYNIYSVVMIFALMFVGMFMEEGPGVERLLYGSVAAYMILFMFRADAGRWVKFTEYRKALRRSMFTTNAEGK